MGVFCVRRALSSLSRESVEKYTTKSFGNRLSGPSRPFPQEGSHFPNLFRFTLGSYLAALPRARVPSPAPPRPPTTRLRSTRPRRRRRRRSHPYKPARVSGTTAAGGTEKDRKYRLARLALSVYLTSNLRAFAENVRYARTFRVPSTAKVFPR